MRTFDQAAAIDKYAGAAIDPSSYTIRRRLEEQKKGLEQQLTQVNSCLQLLDVHPEFEQFMDAFRNM